MTHNVLGGRRYTLLYLSIYPGQYLGLLKCYKKHALAYVSRKIAHIVFWALRPNLFRKSTLVMVCVEMRYVSERSDGDHTDACCCNCCHVFIKSFAASHSNVCYTMRDMCYLYLGVDNRRTDSTLNR